MSSTVIGRLRGGPEWITSWAPHRRQAVGVIGWTSAIAAFGPFLFGVGLTIKPAPTFYWIGIAWAVMCVGLTIWRYVPPGAPKRS